MAYTISPSMGEPYTVTALIVITLGGFGSMGGALAGGLLLGVVEALGMHFTNPSLKTLLSLRGLHRRADAAAQRTVLADARSMSQASFSCATCWCSSA